MKIILRYDLNENDTFAEVCGCGQKGWVRVTVVREPDGHRWLEVAQFDWHGPVEGDE